MFSMSETSVHVLDKNREISPDSAVLKFLEVSNVGEARAEKGGFPVGLSCTQPAGCVLLQINGTDGKRTRSEGVPFGVSIHHISRTSNLESPNLQKNYAYQKVISLILSDTEKFAELAGTIMFQFREEEKHGGSIARKLICRAWLSRIDAGRHSIQSSSSVDIHVPPEQQALKKPLSTKSQFGTNLHRPV